MAEYLNNLQEVNEWIDEELEGLREDNAIKDTETERLADLMIESIDDQVNCLPNYNLAAIFHEDDDELKEREIPELKPGAVLTDARRAIIYAYMLDRANAIIYA